MKNEKEHIFNHNPTESEIEKALFHYDPEKDPNDPRCIHYKRAHTIPKIDWKNAFNNALLIITFAVTIGLYLNYYFSNIYLTIILPLGLVLFCVIFNIKKIAIFFVQVYQRYTPIKIRNKCRFYPSCSDYMILAIEKYGFAKGFIKGCKRIRRCKYPNGGYDYP